MSLGSFIRKIVKAIEKTWLKIVPEIKDKSELAVELLDKIKEGANYATLIAGLDPEMVAKIQVFLRDTVVKAGYVKNYIDGMDEDSILQSIRNSIETATTNGDIHRNVFLNSLSILITDVFADGKIGWDDLVFIPKFIYSFIKKK